MTSDDETPQQSANRFRAQHSHDWRALVETRANVLVQGQRAALDQFLEAVRPALRQPVAIVECGPAISLHRVPTIVLANVDRLGVEEQRALHAWASDARNTGSQIIALTSVPLFRFVEARTFDCDLYYRLNTILVQLDCL